MIEQDRYNMVSTSYDSMTVNELFDFYVRMKQKRGEITIHTIENYTKVWNKNMRKRKFAEMQKCSIMLFQRTIFVGIMLMDVQKNLAFTITNP